MVEEKIYQNALTFIKPKSIKEKTVESTTYFSFAWSRFISGLIFIGFGIADFILLGHLIGHQNEESIGIYVGQGNAVFLGGVSFFYTVGLVPLIIGIWLVIFAIFSAYKGDLSRSESSYYFHEKRPISPQFTELRQSGIKRLRYRNNHLGPKKVWFFLLIPMSIRVLQFGFPLFGEHRAADEILPTLMVLTGLGNFIALFLLVFFPQKFLEFSTSEKTYKTWIAPFSFGNNPNDSLLKTLEFSKESAESPEEISSLSTGKISEGTHQSLNVDVKSQKNYFRLILGGFLLVISIISLSFEILFSTNFSMIGSTYGILLIVQAYNNDFAEKISIKLDPKTKVLNYSKFFKKKIYMEKLSDVDKVGIIEHFRKCDLLDIISTSILIYLSAFESILGWKYHDFSSPLIMVDVFFTILFCSCLLVLLMYYWAIPVSTLNIKVGDENLYLEIPVNSSFKQIFNNTVKKLKKCTQEPQNKKRFFLRAGIIFGIHIIALVIVLLI
ncbi:MAG: hypothetical protein ACTSRX_02205 [Promethearchaeota archaeon]